jgi:lipopolysaccharide export system permease protein
MFSRKKDGETPKRLQCLQSSHLAPKLGRDYPAAGMRLLDRYVLRELAVPLAYCLGGFLIFWISFDLFSDLDEFQREKLKASDILLYYGIRTPELLVTVMPVGLLLALLYSLTNHARHHELVAMRAAGVSLSRICVPYVLVGVLFSLTLFYLNERVTPRSIELAREVRKRGQPEELGRRAWRDNVNFVNAHEQYIWHIGAYNVETSEMREPQITWQEPDGGSRVLLAKSGARTNDQWVFYDIQLNTYGGGVEIENNPRPIRTNMMVVAELVETPADIKLQIKFHALNAYDAAKKPQLSLQEIDYLRSHLNLNKRDRALLETQWHARLAQPWTCLVVVILAVPFAAGSGRRNVFVGVASSIFIVFAYFILTRVGLALGTGLYAPPWLAAWFPNLFFASLGLGLGMRTR